MKRASSGTWGLTALLIVLGGNAAAFDEKPSELKATMKKIGDGSSGLYIKLGRELRSDPTWADAAAMSKEIMRLSAGLGKLTPPLGDKASWDKNAKAFSESLAALDKAIGRQDQPAAFAAWKQLEGGACMNCHKAHRPK